jgi:branched-subunit amino acid ABC-type transport system permease component
MVVHVLADGIGTKIFLPILPGLAEGMLLLVIATGLTLTFGTMRILNMAHGAFFMLGAFVAYSASVSWSQGGSVVIPIAAAVLTCTIVGIVCERVVYRRLYRFDGLRSLLGTFALFLAMAAIAQQIWGTQPLGASIPSVLGGRLSLFGVDILTYQVFIIVIGAVVVVGLRLWLSRTRMGLEVRAIAADRQMASALGVRAERVFWVMFAVGCGLAGLAGALIMPLVQVSSDLGADYIVLAFAVVLIGGLGSFGGAVIASLVLGLVDAFTASYLQSVEPYAIFLTLIVFLTLRPFGLFGTAAAVIEI